MKIYKNDFKDGEWFYSDDYEKGYAKGGIVDAKLLEIWKKHVEKNKDGIKSLNNKHTADLFIDCTGFKSLLLSKELEEPFESYENLLPNNSSSIGGTQQGQNSRSR